MTQTRDELIKELSVLIEEFTTRHTSTEEIMADFILAREQKLQSELDQCNLVKNNSDKWMKWCDEKVLEQNEDLKKELAQSLESQEKLQAKIDSVKKLFKKYEGRLVSNQRGCLIDINKAIELFGGKDE